MRLPIAPSLDRRRSTVLVALVGSAALLAPVIASCVSGRSAATEPQVSIEERIAHLDRVRQADFCASCHPEATAEHRLNTHGRAFTDEEVRLATARFSTPGCIPCHTPRPVFETGIGMNPLQRFHHLEEGNDCLSCHAKAGYDFSVFQGGDECRAAFDDRVGKVEACASCHRNHGTPYQWENAQWGNLSDNACVDCHMPEVVRPIAVGMAPTKTRRHTFFASRSESQLRMAYDYAAERDGNEVVVRVENAGAGHNFPTELKQRSVESLVVIRDVAGREVARSRHVFRDPYKRPYGLTLPVNTQIPSGETREHRVPIPVSHGTVETTLFYKLYFPVQDEHPTLTRTLERRSLAFGPITPSTKPIETAPEIHAALPEAIPVEAASPGNLADFAHPSIASVPVEVPDGTREGDVEKLVALFQFPVPEANRKAQDVLVSLGERSLPALVAALGSWDNKTWMQAQKVLERLGPIAAPAIVRALTHPELYVRFHAREILPRFDAKDAVAPLVAGLSMENPVDRISSAEALGAINAVEAAPELRRLLDEIEFDAVATAAKALARLGDAESVPAIRRALGRFRRTAETARDLAWSLAALGETDGISVLLDLLDHRDDLVRESVFEAYLDVTGRSLGFGAMLGSERRAEALAELRTWWAEHGSRKDLRRPRSLTDPAKLRVEAAKLVREVGGNDVHGNDPAVTEKAIARLIEIGGPAVPAIVEGLKWPAGFADKRAGLLRVLCEVPDADALPAIQEALHDPVLAVASWALRAAEVLGDPHAIPEVRELESRLDTLAAVGRVPGSVGHPEDLRVAIGRTLQTLGDDGGTRLLLRLLFSGEATARFHAEQALRAAFETERAREPLVAEEVRARLAALPELRAAQVQGMRAEWERLVTEAEAAADAATSQDERLAALEKFDFAEEAASRYFALDPRAFDLDLRRTRLAADALAFDLYDGGAFAAGVTPRVLTSLVERKGWAQTREGFTASFEGDVLTIEALADGAGGGLTFGIGGPGGAGAPIEWWRDYELSMEVDVVRQGFWILDRYDPIWAISHATACTTRASSTAGVLSAVVEEGKSYAIVHSVRGGDVFHRQTEIGATGDAASIELSTGLPGTVRKGGVVFQLDVGAKVVIRKLRLKVLRADAAEALNAVLATPGR